VAQVLLLFNRCRGRVNNVLGDVYLKIAVGPKAGIVETYDKCERLP
jgi:hypothetical protein